MLLYNNIDLFATCTLKTWICTHSALPCRQKTLQFLQFVFSVVIARSEALAVILSEAKDLLVKTRFFANEAQTRNTIVYAPDLQVATLGVEDLVIAQAGGTLLVARLERLDELKTLVEKVSREGWEGV